MNAVTRSRTTRTFAAVAATCLVWTVGAADAGAAPTVKRFTATGAAQFFAVPDGITNIHVVAIGGQGGRASGFTGATAHPGAGWRRHG